jgi:hypothetical protein
MADPFDEFEFKPLTEGLGFHKKTEKPKAEARRSSIETERTPQKSAERTSRAPIEVPSARSLLLGDDNETPERLSFDTPTPTAPSNPSSKSISDLIASLPPSLDFISTKEEESLDLSTRPATPTYKTTEPDTGRPQIFQPLARSDYSDTFGSGASAGLSKKPATPAAPTIGNVLPPPGTKAAVTTSTMPAVPVPTIPKPTAPSPFKERLDESFARAFPHAEKLGEKKADVATDKAAAVSTNLVPVPAHFGAIFVDGMVVTGMATILLVCIVAITRVNLMGLLSNAQTDGPTQIHLALLGIAVMHLYLLTARSFFGASLGEWAFDLQMGTDADQARATYPLQVAWRSIAVTLSGLALLPLLSLIFGRDLLRYITGLQLFNRP